MRNEYFMNHSVSLFPQEPVLLFRVNVCRNCVSQVRQRRQEFLQRAQHMRHMDREISVTYPIG